MSTTIEVVIIEDDIVDTRHALRCLEKVESLLADTAINATTFSSSREGLEHIARHTDTDLLILDVHIPDMDSIELFRAMKERKVQPPVLLVTGVSAVNMRIAHDIGIIYGNKVLNQVSKPLTENEIICALTDLGFISAESSDKLRAQNRPSVS